MKRIHLILLAASLLMTTGCKESFHDEIPYCGGSSNAKIADVNVRINWDDGQTPPIADGMRVNIFSLDNGVKDYGVDDLGYTGGIVKLFQGTTYRTLAYSYQSNNIYFRGETNANTLEAYCSPMTRATYSDVFPQDNTVTQPLGDFYTGENPSYKVKSEIDNQYIDVSTEDRIVKYTFEVRNVNGAEFIKAARGSISGMSNSYFIGTGKLSDIPVTVLFNASVDVAGGKITGSFQTFGRLDTKNNFSIEILFPSNTNGIRIYTWEVTSQINDGVNRHIIIDNSGIDIPDEGGEAASGWEVDLQEWENEDVILN